MIRRVLVPLIGSGLLLVATAGSALAKCEGPTPPEFCNQVIASLSTGGGSSLSLTAGTTTTVDVNVTRGEMPFVPDSVVLVFHPIAGGAAVEIPAERGAAASWHAQVNLPYGGSWTVVAELGVDGVIERTTFEPFRVAAAAEALEAPVTTPPATPISPAPPVLPIALAIAAAAAGALTAVALRGRSRRRVSAG